MSLSRRHPALEHFTSNVAVDERRDQRVPWHSFSRMRRCLSLFVSGTRKEGRRRKKFAIWILVVTIAASSLYSSWALARPHVSKVLSSTLHRLDLCTRKSKILESACQAMGSSKSDGALGFREFLSRQDGTEDHLVLGNEAGDADSIVSALTLAYVDSLQSSKSPVVSINRADLCLRRETVLLLKLAGLDAEELVYIDDLDPDQTRRRKLTLVDHNCLTERFRGMFDVVEIVDHHHDLGDHPQVTGAARDIAFSDELPLVGSTCTQVVERMVKLLPPQYNPELSLPLLGVILLDTANMSVEADKGTERDKVAIDTILRQTDWSLMSDEAAFMCNEDSNTPDPTKLYEYLRDSKFDPEFWNELTVKDALRLDYKGFQANGDVFGASAVLMPLSSFMSKPDLGNSLEAYLAESDIPLLAILSFSLVNLEPQRELLVCGNDDKLVSDMSGFLLQSTRGQSLELKELTPVKVSETMTVRRFRQGNVRASRKQVVPIMLQFYNGG